MPPKAAPRRSLAKDSPSPAAKTTPVPKPRSRASKIQATDDNDDELPVRLFVGKLPDKCSEDLLINYFESKRRFGQVLDVEKVEYRPEKSQAVIVFRTNADLQIVLKVHRLSPCVLSKEEIHIEEYREDCMESEQGTKTMIVRGYDLTKSTDSLLYYFENSNRSGGGEVQKLTPDLESDYILVTFIEEKVVESVVNQANAKPHIVDGCRLSVKGFLYSKTDIMFTNIPDSVSEESLRNFLEARLNVAVSDGPMAYNISRDRAVVKFTDVVYLVSTERICLEKQIEGSHLVPFPVAVTSTVLVVNLPDDLSEDTCRYYFENKRKSGGGTIDDINLQLDDGYCLISFKDTKVVDSVCQREGHNIQGTLLKVTPYHICLGKPSSLNPAQPWSLPEPIVTKRQHESKFKYLNYLETKKTMVDETFQRFYAVVHWNKKPVVIECSLSKNVKGYRKLAKTWNGDVSRELTRIVDNLKERRFTSDEGFPLFRKELKSINLDNAEEVAVFVEKNENTVILVSTQHVFKKAECKIQEKFDKVLDELARQKQKICKRKKFEEWQVRYFQMKKLEKDILKDHPNVVVKLDATDCELVATGPQTEVNDVILMTYEIFETVQKKYVRIPAEALTLLVNLETQRQISDQIQRGRLLDLWEIHGDSVTVYTEAGEDYSKKKMIFKKFYEMVEFDIDAASEILLREDKWLELEQTLNRQFQGGFVIKKKNNIIKICARSDVKVDIQNQFQTFLSKNSITREEVRVDKYVLQFVLKYMDRELETKLRAIKENTMVELEYKKADLVLLQGTTEGLGNAKRLLQQLTERVKFQQHPLQRPGIKQYMMSTKGQESIKSVETNTPCIIHIADSVAPARSTDQTQTLQMLGLMQDCAEGTLPTGQRVIVYGGNMLQLKVDVIVNAGNAEMKHSGGLAAAILKSGGRSIQRECSDFIAKHGSVNVGDVLVSGAGTLPCRYIVHAVGPQWKGGDKQEPQFLELAIENCLIEADSRQCTSIALPALCTGVYKYPVNKACVLIITTIHQYFQNQRNSSIQDVYLCDINPKTVNEFVKALSAIVGIKQVPAQGSQQNAKAQRQDNPNQGGRKDQIGTSTVFGNTKVEVVKGNITSEKVDVIINSASCDLDLKKGKASHAILKAGGASIQDECKKNFPNGISVGEVAMTTGGSLKCKNILHICLDPYSHKKSVESLEACVENCLIEAEKCGSQSIAFPALGTGAQGFPANIAAESMFKCVSSYCQRQKDQTSIKSVKFVVFHMDSNIFQAFVAAIAQYQQTAVNSSPAPAMAADPSKLDKKIINISKDSAEFQIGEVKVNVIQGDITEQDTTAVVASSNSDLDLINTGQVTKALLAKGGPDIQQDCDIQRPKMKATGIAVTTGGQLKCQHIIFVDAPSEIKQWEQVVFECLQAAEGQGMTSVSFPALGTVMGHDPGRIATSVYLAICQFVSGRTNTKALQEIRMVIFQASMLDPVINGFKASLQGQSILSHIGNMFFGKKSKSKQAVAVTDKPDVIVAQPSLVQDSVSTDGSSDVESDICSLTIYADADQKINKALRRLEKMVNDEWFSQKIDDPSVLKLDTTQIDSIQATAKKNNVLVKIDQDVGGIEIQGLIGNVMPVKDLIYAELRDFDRVVHEKKHAELLTNVVKWFWIDGSTSNAFEDVNNMKVENAYKNTEAKITLTDLAMKEDFEVNLQQMLMFYVEQPKQVYPVIRRDLIADTGTEIPMTWEPMGKDENLRMVKLVDTSKEFKDVLAEFTKTLGKTPNVIEINRIQNKTLYTQYAAKRRLMESNNQNMKNEYVLWHGTDVNAVANITAHGYNRSYCGKNATRFGEGVYFAVNSQYSDQNGYARPDPSTGHKRMYRALVLVGNYTTGVQGMRVPPVMTKGNPDVLYDSVTNNMQDPAMFIIFHDTQAYPEHIITYT